MERLLNLFLAIPTALAQNNYAQNGGNQNGIASQTGDQLQGLAMSFVGAIPLWITGIVVIGLSMVLAKIVKSAVENRIAAEGMEEEHREIQIVASRAAGTAVLTVGITTGLKIAGLDLTSVLAAGAFGIGFAMKDIIMNFLAGIIVLLQRQFTIGDWIKVSGTTGIIQEIQSRYTVLKTFDGTKVIIPNAELFKKQVVSFTSNPYRRFSVTLAVDLYHDLQEVIHLIHQSMKKVPNILQSPKPSIHVLQPGAYANHLKINCWVESRKGILGARTKLMQQLHKDFYARGWSWPYPTQTLVFDKDVAPDITLRTKNYMENHRQSLQNAGKLEHELEKEQALLAIQQETLGGRIDNPSQQAFPGQINIVPENPGSSSVQVPINQSVPSLSQNPLSMQPQITPPLPAQYHNAPSNQFNQNPPILTQQNPEQMWPASVDNVPAWLAQNAAQIQPKQTLSNQNQTLQPQTVQSQPMATDNQISLEIPTVPGSNNLQ